MRHPSPPWGGRWAEIYYRRRSGDAGRRIAVGSTAKLTDRSAASRGCERASSGELIAHTVERAPDQPRHVHLGYADLIGDLRLGEAVLEAHAEDLALPRRQPRERRLERRPVVGALVLEVLGADRLHRVE